MTLRQKFKETFFNTFRVLFRFSTVLLFLFLIARIFEYFLTPEKGLFPHTLFYVLVNDIIFSYILIGYFFIPAFILYLLAPMFTRILFMIIYALVLIIHICLLTFFFNSNVMLGSDLFGYTLSEIVFTADASGGFNFWIVAAFVFSLAIFFFLTWFFRSRFNLIRERACLVYAIIVAVIFFTKSFTKSKIENYKSEYEFYFCTNKTAYFFDKSIEYYNFKGSVDDFVDDKSYYLDGPPPDEILDTAKLKEDTVDEKGNKINKADYKNGTDEFTFFSQTYPFLHNDNYRNTLRPYFKKGNSTERPNVVVFILESVGKAYSGKDASLGSFTPFLDSLAQNSLYWENCLSGGGRTFAAIPSVLGSLPFLEHGYLEAGDKAPLASSLIRVLNCNGYTSSFYYGSEATFDKMDIFLKNQGAKITLDALKFPANYRKLPSKGNGFSWGYGDLDLFKRYFEINSSEKTPRLDIILTVANHDPFLIPEQDKYIEQVKARMASLNLKAKTKEFLGSYLQELSCVMYSDNALRYFFNEFAKRDEFKNTIFIITGDHRMSEIPIGTQIDRFHVPLIIYSPLLNRPSIFKSVVTHFDITPAILKLLKSNYHIQYPSQLHWIGKSLDTARTFECNRKVALMRNKTELMDYLDGMAYLANDKLYVLEDNLEIEEDHDVNRLKRLRAEFDIFKNNNTAASKADKLAPDSVIKCK